MHSETKRWIGLISILIVVVALIGLSRLVPAPQLGAFSVGLTLHVAVGLLPLVFVPLASRLFPAIGYKPIAMTRWAMVIALVFLAQLVTGVLDRYRPQHDLAANGLFVILLGVVSLGAFLILTWKRGTQ